MSLRLLPAFSTDNEDDDDGNFTKWMSSYWGHGAEGGEVSFWTEDLSNSLVDMDTPPRPGSVFT
uniref:Uncharacterized protein n=1 Tax=Cynoglossus semilaevis TaxID=244447 RepID=A0A3P8V9Z8_CYNSE